MSTTIIPQSGYKSMVVYLIQKRLMLESALAKIDDVIYHDCHNSDYSHFVELAMKARKISLEIDNIGEKINSVSQ